MTFAGAGILTRGYYHKGLSESHSFNSAFEIVSVRVDGWGEFLDLSGIVTAGLHRATVIEPSHGYTREEIWIHIRRIEFGNILYVDCDKWEWRYFDWQRLRFASSCNYGLAGRRNSAVRIAFQEVVAEELAKCKEGAATVETAPPAAGSALQSSRDIP